MRQPAAMPLTVRASMPLLHRGGTASAGASGNSGNSLSAARSGGGGGGSEVVAAASSSDVHSGSASGPWVRLNFEIEHPTGGAWTRADLDQLDAIAGLTDLRISADRPGVITCTVCDSAAAARAVGNAIAKVLPRAPVVWSVDTSRPSVDPGAGSHASGGGTSGAAARRSMQANLSGNFRASQTSLPGSIAGHASVNVLG